MIILGTNFKLKSTSPNFERDSISSDDLLLTTKAISNKYDVGHLVYCNDGSYSGKHFIYRGEHKEGYVGLFEEIHFLTDGDYSKLTKPFQYQGDISDISQASSADTGYVYRVNVDEIDSFIVPSGQSITNEVVSASTGDMVVCVGKRTNETTSATTPVFSVIQNNLEESGLVKKDTSTDYETNEVTVYSDSTGNKIKGSGILLSDIVQLASVGSSAHNTIGFPSSGGTGVEIPAVDGDGNLVDTQVTVDTLQQLQKEIQGTEVTDVPESAVTGTLADLLNKFRDNGYDLGSSVSPISAFTEGKFVKDIQKVLDKNKKNVGFVAPLVLFRNDTPASSADVYVFQDYISSALTSVNVEANVRNDGLGTSGETIFHLDFELDTYGIQYWYKGGTESAIYYVKYSLSDKVEYGPEMTLWADEEGSSGGGE